MANCHELTPAERKRLLRWAVVEHYRSWLIVDGVELRRVANGGGILDRKAVRRIAKEYKVNRGIRITKDASGKKIAGRDDHADWLAQRLNKEAVHWPDGLIARAERCAEVARSASNGHTRGEQASAITKLMWFLRPSGWTVFDDLAANGLGIPKLQAINRMPAFYRSLSERNFGDHANSINLALRKTSFRKLHGERIIDSFLMMAGAENDWTDEVINTCACFFELLPTDAREELDVLAWQIAENHAMHMLT